MSRPLSWQPPGWGRVVVIDSHTGGEPFRVVVEGAPEISGATMAEQRRHAESELDEFRRALMWEPRGHADMYGGIIGPPVAEGSDLSVLFLHNDGFSTMCGHGIIALVKVVLDTGILPPSGPETTLRIDTPAGTVSATATLRGGSVEEVRFLNVPSYVVELDARVEVPGVGNLGYDLAFGGAFYAYVPAGPLGLGLHPSEVPDLIALGRRIKQSVASSRPVDHPLVPDLGFLYGVIFTGEPTDPGHWARNVCVFANGEVDRSPTGTGVSGHLAIEHARGRLEVGEPMVVESLLGTTFTGRIVEAVVFEGRAAVIPEVGGTAAITGRSELWFDPNDPLGDGFLLR